MPVASTSTSAPSPPPLPALTPVAESLLACRFSSWYPSLRKVSPKATIIDVEAIQPDFYDWLEEDGLILPLGSGEGVIGGDVESRSSLDFDQDASGEGSDEKSGRSGAGSHADDSDSDSESDESAYEARDFSRLDEKIREVIEKYGGDVFPKLDWSAPRDAAWILPGQTLKCTTPADVYLLLKSSDFISKDLMQAQELRTDAHSAQNGTTQPEDLESEVPAELASLSLSTASDPTTGNSIASSSASSSHKVNLNLVLKRHFAVNPSHEFRCFVRAGTFVAVAQRDGTYYDFLQPKTTQKDVRQKLHDFWQGNLRDRLGISSSTSGTPLQDYVFDAYFTKDRSRVFVMDVNPYLPRTDALLWDWDELEELAQRIHARQWKQRNGIALSDGDDSDDSDEDEDGEDGEDSGRDSQASDDEDAERSHSTPHTDAPGQESFMRIYLDGSRPPELLTRPITDSGSQPPPRPQLPRLRLADNDPSSCGGGGGGSSFTSGASSRGGPTYASNMMPRDVLDVSSGRGIEEFARIWKEEVEKAS